MFKTRMARTKFPDWGKKLNLCLHRPVNRTKIDLNANNGSLTLYTLHHVLTYQMMFIAILF